MTSTAKLASRKVAKYLEDTQEPDEGELEFYADEIVCMVISALLLPDRSMIDAGSTQLAAALPDGSTIEWRRNLAAAVFRTMLHEAEAPTPKRELP